MDLSQLPELLLPWFAAHARDLPWRRDRNPYHVWLSEIMLQQTRVETVKAYYTRFLEAIPDISTLAATDLDQLQKLWEGLGYYSRVKNLHIAAGQIMEKFGGVFPTDYDSIRSLKGVGDYTAGAIASICFDLPVPAVDGNVLRVIARITGDGRSIDDTHTKSEIREMLRGIYPTGHCGEFTQALMELGALICIPRGVPVCEKCPAASICTSRNGAWAKLPVRTQKKSRKTEKFTVFILRCNGKIAVDRRGDTGLLAGLWEFPNVPGDLEPDEAIAQAEHFGLHPRGILREARRSHTFTHVEWDMRGYYMDCQQEAPAFVWVSREDMRRLIALPTAFRQFWAL